MAIQMSLERAKFLIFLFFGANAIIRQIIQPIAGRENSKFNPKNAPGRHNCILSVILGRLAIIIRLRLSILLAVRSGILILRLGILLAARSGVLILRLGILLAVRSGVLILRLGILRLGLLCSILLGGFHPSSAFGAEYSIIRHIKTAIRAFFRHWHILLPKYEKIYCLYYKITSSSCQA